MKKKLYLFISVMTFGCTTIFAQQTDVTMPNMIPVEGGTFMMGNNAGSKDEKPVHKVTLNSFYIGEYEVTLKDFRKFVNATGYKTDAEQPDTFRRKHGLPPRGINNGSWKMNVNNSPVPATDSMNPVGNISWNDAMEYCKWLSKSTGKTFRLPTEAEWEFAARGGLKSKNFKYAGGNILDDVAWVGKNSNSRSHTVGKKMANELGIYDMAGNVSEWCADWYGAYYYQTSPEENPAGPGNGSHRVLRGGSWANDEGRMRISYRNNEYPYNSARSLGFRLAIPGEPVVKKPAPVKADPMSDLDTKGFIDIYGINFDIGKAIVKAESFPVIEQITTYLKEHSQVRVMIEGHTDNTGKAELNLALSEKRAQSIRDEIVKRGIDSGRMETKGFGPSKPIADNKTAAGRTQNRRVTIKKL